MSTNSTNMARALTRRVGALTLAATLLALTATLLALTAPAALGAGAAQACQVRNVTQDTIGQSLKVMVEVAHDGDRLRVQGTCAGDVVIDKDVAIRGVGGAATLDGRNERRGIRVKPGATATVAHLSIIRAIARNGGGIHNEGTLTLTDSSVRRSWGANQGGASYNRGTLTMTGSSLRNNYTNVRNGAGIYNDIGGVAFLTESTVEGNQALSDDPGGGIFNAGTMSMVDSTVEGNGSGL